MKWIVKQFYNIGLTIDTLIYHFTSMSYRVFSLVSGVSLFDNDGNSIIETITNRIYVILGVVMLFVLAYEVLKAIADPDKITASDDMSIKGIAKNSIIALAILAFLPVIFKYMAVFQNNIVKQNVIGNIILGSTAGTDDDYLDVAGVKISISIFSTFFHPTDEDMTSCQDLINDYLPEDYDGTEEIDSSDLDVDSDDEDRLEVCATYINAKNKAEKNRKFKYFSKDDYLSDNIVDESKMEYSPLLGAIAGAIACYMFLSYAIDAGKRVAKLAFYEIIAPIPVICKIFKPEIFKKWLKDITQTYLELFLRLAIVFFVVYLISIIPELDLFHRGDHTGGLIVVTFANCIIILGLLAFAKEAPKLIEDLLQIKIGELSIKKKLKENEYAQRALGMGAGAVMGSAGRIAKRIDIANKNGETGLRKGISIAGGALGGFFGGARRGLTGNYENGLRAGIENAHDANMSAGANRDAARDRGRSETGKNIGGINTLLGGARNLGDGIKSKAGSIWNTTVGYNNQNVAASYEALKELNNSKIDINPKATDIKNATSARDEFLNKFRSGELNGTDIIQRLKNAGFSLSNQEERDILQNNVNIEDFIKDKYKTKIDKLRVEGITSYDGKTAKEMAKLDSSELLEAFSKFSGSSGLDSTEIQAIQTQIKNLSSKLVIDPNTGKVSDASAQDWLDAKKDLTTKLSALATAAKATSTSSGNKSDKK